jgi:hypothetical protein
MHQKHTDDNDERGYGGDGDQRHDQNHEVDDDNTTDDNTINVQNHLGIHGRTTMYTLIVSILPIVLQYILNDR